MNSKLARWCDGFMEAGWLVALIVTPLFFNIHSERVFEPDKLTLLRSIATLMCLVWVVKFVDGQGWRDLSWLRWNDPQSIWRKPLVLPVVLVVILYLISSAFSVAPRTSLIGSYQRLQGTYSTLAYIAVFAVIVSTLKTRAQVERIVTVVIITSIPVALYGLLQRYQLDPLPWGGDTSRRIAGHMGNSIFIGAYLILAVPITVKRIIDSFYNILTDEELSYADVIRSSIYILAFAIQVLAIFFTQSRGPMIGLTLGMFAFALILLVALRNADTKENQSRSSNLLWPLVYIALCIAALFINNALLGSLGAQNAFYVFVGLVGLLVLSIVVLAAAQIGWSWLWSVWMVMVLFLIGIVITFSAADQFPEQTQDLPVIGALQPTFESWAELPTLSRVGELMNSTEAGSGRVRLLIWEGVLDLIRPHEPIRFSADVEDRWNFLRPLFGYGPESMYVAYNRFYPPELATVEARNASPDRSHNETFDALVITGVLGFINWQFLYVAAFYYGFRQLGVVRGKRDRNMLVGMWVSGALIASLIVMLQGNPALLGIGIPFGSIIGLIAYLVYYALTGARQSNPLANQGYDSRMLLIASLVAALIAFYVEIHFGIAIAATRLHAFVFMALIVVLGSDLFVESTEAAPEAIDATVKTARKTRGKRSSGVRGGSARVPTSQAGSAIWGGMFVMAVLFGTLAFDFVNFTPRPGEIEAWQSAADLPSSLEILNRALFLNPRQNFVDSPYLFGVLVLGWLFGLLLLVSEMIKNGTVKVRAVGLLEDNKTIFAAGTLAASALAGIVTFVRDSDPALVNTNRIATMLSGLWIVLALASAAGVFFARKHPLSRPVAGAIAVLGLLFTLPLFVAGASLVAFLLLIFCGAALYYLWDSAWGDSFGGALTIGFGSFLVGVLYAVVHAGLIRSSFIAPSSNLGVPLEGLTRRVVEAERVGQYLTLYYSFVIVLLIAAAIAFAWSRISAEKQSGSTVAFVLLPVLFIFGLFVVDQYNLNLIQADMVYKRGRPYDQQAGQIMSQINGLEVEQQQQALTAAIDTWDSAVAVYERTIEMAPSEDFYYLWLGRAYLEESQVNIPRQQELLDTAEQRLIRAQKINPLNTDHTANLARLNVRWAQLVTTDADRQQRIDEAKGYYEDALALSPQNSIIRNEYGGLLLSLDSDCESAIDIYRESIEVDRYYEQSYFRLAETYLNCSNRDGEQNLDYLEQASATMLLMEDGLKPRTFDRVKPQIANTQLRIAQSYLAAGEFALARERAEAVLIDAPDLQPQVDALLAQIEASEGNGAVDEPSE